MLLWNIKYYSDLRYQGDDTMVERMELLMQHRESVLEEQRKWEEYLRNLDEKISIYRERIICVSTFSENMVQEFASLSNTKKIAEL